MNTRLGNFRFAFSAIEWKMLEDSLLFYFKNPILPAVVAVYLITSLRFRRSQWALELGGSAQHHFCRCTNNRGWDN
jgi:hypothetical protein